MPQDATFKHIFSFPFMVEELVRWFVGDLHGARELVDHLPAQAAALRARLDAPPLRELLDEVLAWARERALRWTGFDLGVDDMAEVDRLHESGELEAYIAERRRGSTPPPAAERRNDALTGARPGKL